MYLNYKKFKQNLNINEKNLIRSKKLLFTYISIYENEHEVTELPISQQIMISLFNDLNSPCKYKIIKIKDKKIIEHEKFDHNFDYIFLHPMINILPYLGKTIEYLKDLYSNAKIVVLTSDQHQHEKLIGGPDSYRIAIELAKSFPKIDYVINGFAEYSAISLLLNKPTKAIISNTNDFKNKSTSDINFFEYDSLSDLYFKDIDADKQNKSIRVQRSRGCLAPCTYCIEGQANRTLKNEKGWEGAKIDNFVNKLEKLFEKNFFFVNVIDSSFEDPGNRGISNVLDFCNKIIKRQIKLSFKIHLRAESYLKFSYEDFQLMKSAGIDVIVCGVESGNQKELSFFNKIATKQQSLDAYNYAEKSRFFCNILGYMMFTPITDLKTLEEKVEFLRNINRGWDFLNMTNRLLVFWGTKIHQELVNMNLIEYTDDVKLGYVNYEFKSKEVGKLDNIFNKFKIEHPDIMTINNLMYDSLNLVSRLKNPVNLEIYKDKIDLISDFEEKTNQQMSKLNTQYCDNFQSKIKNIEFDYFKNIELNKEKKYALNNINNLISNLNESKFDDSKIYLKTWLSVVNRLGVH